MCGKPIPKLQHFVGDTVIYSVDTDVEQVKSHHALNSFENWHCSNSVWEKKMHDIVDI